MDVGDWGLRARLRSVRHINTLRDLLPGDSNSATLVRLHEASERVVGDRRWADVPEVLASKIIEDGPSEAKRRDVFVALSDWANCVSYASSCSVVLSATHRLLGAELTMLRETTHVYLRNVP